ncbi:MULTISPECIES: hypothetical protein [Microbacterium]|uniref:Uncharacterized protein n=1 Tax=Microbacterium gilvum TaxID=1336204 RepID=A0ABP9A700_9MICO
MKTGTRIGSVAAATLLLLGGGVAVAPAASAATGFTQVSGATVNQCAERLQSQMTAARAAGRQVTDIQGCYYLWNLFGDDYIGGFEWSTMKISR